MPKRSLGRGMFYPILPDGNALYRPLDVPDPLFVRGVDFEVARLLMYRVMLINVLGKRIMQRHAKEYVFNHPEAIKALAQLIYNAYLEYRQLSEEDKASFHQPS